MGTRAALAIALMIGAPAYAKTRQMVISLGSSFFGWGEVFSFTATMRRER